MAIHLLASIDQYDVRIDDIDFGKLLKYSQDQCVIIEQSYARFLGCGLPDRTVIVVGTDDDPIWIGAYKVVGDVKEAIVSFKQSVFTDAVIVGRSSEFNRQALAVSDYVHLDIESSSEREAELDGRFADVSMANGWVVCSKETLRAQPKERFDRRIKVSYQRLKVATGSQGGDSIHSSPDCYPDQRHLA